MTHPALWFGMTPADWSVLSSIATIAGVVIALFAGIIALRSYLSANRMANNEHMHALFRDYLRTQFETELGLMSLGKARDTDESRIRLGDQAAPLKLYVLEEMWLWLDAQVGRARKQMYDAWAATILSHVRYDTETVLYNLKGATDCYSLGFLKFLADGLGDENPEFRLIYEDQANLLARRESRTPYDRRQPS